LKVFTIGKEIELKAPIEKVFSSLTNTEEIPKFFPIKSVESTWKAGSEVLYMGEVNGNPFTDYRPRNFYQKTYVFLDIIISSNR